MWGPISSMTSTGYSRGNADLRDRCIASSSLLQSLGLPKDATIAVVRYEGNPGQQVSYGFRQTLEIPWASQIDAMHRFAPNMFLYGAGQVRL
jgi:hypothetical protein